jgi:succinate dehydrogenase/fumarate reductase flavoprotein subunit
MEKEVAEGRGPIRYEASEFFYRSDLAMQRILYAFNRPEAEAWWHHQEWLGDVYMTDHAHRPEAIPQFIGEMACTRVGSDMRTTMPGLWAIGDASQTGSGWAGACPPPGRMRGSGLVYAGVSAMLCAPSVAEYAASVEPAVADAAQVAAFKEEIYEPMGREKGLNPRDVIYDLQTVITPPRFAINKDADRIDDALAMAAICKAKLSETSPQNDYHMLGLYHDLRQMITCSEIYYNAALFRTESRGFHHREDHPQRDDANWLKWVIVRDIDGKMNVEAEDIPIANYKRKP